MSYPGFLYVGDMHVQKQNRQESVRLIQWIGQLSKKLGMPIVFGGDQYDDHGIAHVEIIEFWVQSFEFLSEHPIVALVGNHDKNHEGDASAMTSHHKPGI